MKRIIFMLLIACSTLATFAATSPDLPKKPEKVIANLNAIIDIYGHKAGQSFAINRNPNTNIIESSEKIATFSCNTSDRSFETIAESFMADEPLCYQILHLVPGNKEVFKLKVVTNEGSKSILLRSKNEQEMWLMCTKNPENPQLRDAYAIVWEEGDFFGDKEVEGTVYMITSLRPDIYEKNAESNKRMFKIEGRVDANIADSLYNIYIADSRDALYALDDDDYVACVPVVNKRFEFQTELDHPMVGRLRCIFPDGSLCSAWIDLDFVPGETYRITVHNGYYDEDRDYERRVGRQSGRSLLVKDSGREQAFVARLDSMFTEGRYWHGNESSHQVVAVGNTLAVESDNEMEWWMKTISPEQKMRFEMKGKVLEGDMEALQGIYEQVGEKFSEAQEFNKKKGLVGNGMTPKLDPLYEQIVSLNKKMDADIQDLLKEAISAHMPASGLIELYGHMLGDTYSDQNKALTVMLLADPSKKGKKTQKYVQKLMEKYMEEMNTLVNEPKW
ncbi:MAG: hypothetical protein J5548_10335 [Prevotella sp.]|nr:hypothetical protein [Prevotella sp.]